MPRRILVVEDDEKSRRLLTDVLEYHGFDVCAVPSGEEGLADAKACCPDAALLDIQLPGISGFDVLLQLRAESAGAHLRSGRAGQQQQGGARQRQPETTA